MWEVSQLPFWHVISWLHVCLMSFRRPEGECLITRSMSPQGRPLFLQSSRNISVNIVNSNNQLLTQLVTGKARQDVFHVAYCWCWMWSMVHLKHRFWCLHQEHMKLWVIHEQEAFQPFNKLCGSLCRKKSWFELLTCQVILTRGLELETGNQWACSQVNPTPAQYKYKISILK